MNEPTPWHRLFGLSWINFFQGTSVEVLTEVDLSVKQQFVDLVLIRKGAEPIGRPLPDGFEYLAPRNLLTFKSHQEALDKWALQELVGHYVNYRKQCSPSMNELLPESDFRLFAVCARYPQNLTNRIVLAKVREGVYEANGFDLSVRIVVVGELPQSEHNVMLHMFSAREELLAYGRAHYRPHSQEMSSLLLKLFKAYSEEPNMPDRLKEFVRQTIDELQSLPAEELRKRLTPEECLKGIPAEERLKGLSAEEILKGLKGLPPETLEALVRQIKANGSSTKPQ